MMARLVEKLVAALLVHDRQNRAEQQCIGLHDRAMAWGDQMYLFAFLEPLLSAPPFSIMRVVVRGAGLVLCGVRACLCYYQPRRPVSTSDGSCPSPRSL